MFKQLNKFTLILGVLFLLSGIGFVFIESYIKSKNSYKKYEVEQIITQESSEIKKEKLSFKLEVVTQNLFVPWSILFTAPERILVAQRSGAIKVIQNGKLLPENLIEFSEVSKTEEEGLMGLEKDPEYLSNKKLYACLAYKNGNEFSNKVVSFVDNTTSVSNIQTLLDNLPSARYHAGCRLKFGPDKKLYISLGDAVQKNDAQDLKSLAGKILRINPDGTFPTDNPFTNSPVWSYGHRNPQGIAWDSKGNMYSSEHGPSLIDGPAGGDEINLIKPGGNFGWPLVSHENTREGTQKPLVTFTPAVAPASLVIYKDDLYFGGLRGEGIFRIIVDSQDPSKVVSYEKLPEVNLGRIRDIVEGPDGNLYFSTSNLDGRGTVPEEGDAIYKLTPQN